MQNESISKNVPIDIFRETYLRYFGYLGTFSGFFRRPFPLNIARMSCTTYFVSDLSDKLPSESQEKGIYQRNALVNGGDVVIFHFVSSLLVPSLLSKSVKIYCAKSLSVAGGIAKFTPAVVSIAVISLASRVIDSVTNKTMDISYRKIFMKSSETTKSSVIIRNEEEQFSNPIFADIQ